MIRRLGLTILATVLGTLLISAAVAYIAVRTVLIGNLDSRLFARAASLPELVHTQNIDPKKIPGYDPSDEYEIAGDPHGTIAPGGAAGSAAKLPAIVDATFKISPTGQRRRLLTIKALERADHPGAVSEPVIVTYSGSMERVDMILRRLAFTLGIYGLIGGLLASFLSMRISRLLLRPLMRTAAQIGTIDEQKLDSRINVKRLPPELAPIALRLNEMLAQLERAFTRRKQFLADASHELRTPVAALVTTLDIALRVPQGASEYRQVLRDCAQDAKLLRRLVERLTEHAKGEFFAQQALPEPTDVNALIEQCAQMAQVLGHERSVKVTCAVPPDLICVIQTDRLRSIIMNLLANAVEHSAPRGEVEIACSYSHERLRIAVRDEGPGIAAEHIPHVFEPFYRVDKAHVRDCEHLGLGLFLVQSHLKAMGGNCSVDTKVGLGSTFQIDLPCSAVAPQESDAAALLVGASID